MVGRLGEHAKHGDPRRGDAKPGLAQTPLDQIGVHGAAP
jgi:hypothetical protein